MGKYEELESRRESMNKDIQRLIKVTEEYAETVKYLSAENFVEARENIADFISGGVKTLQMTLTLQNMVFDMLERENKMKLTKQQAVEKHRKMWNRIADQYRQGEIRHWTVNDGI